MQKVWIIRMEIATVTVTTRVMEGRGSQLAPPMLLRPHIRGLLLQGHQHQNSQHRVNSKAPDNHSSGVVSRGQDSQTVGVGLIITGVGLINHHDVQKNTAVEF